MEKNSTDMLHDHVETVQLAGKVQEAPVTDTEDGGERDYAIRTRHLVRKIDIRLVPLCAFLYLLNYLDRGNIGNAKVLNSETKDDLLSQTKTSPHGYAMTLTIFAIAYSVFDVPSNIVMKRYVLPSRWLATLLFCWGALTLGFAGVKNFTEMVVLRFFIGVFEAGFFPGIVYLITFWYRPEERSLRIAFVLASATLAGAFGGCIAYGVGFLNGHAGLEGFRWLFIIEGILTMICTLLVLIFVPNYPAAARWLDEDEKSFAQDRLEAVVGGFTRAHASRDEMLETVLSPRMAAHYLTYFTTCVLTSSLSYFAPTIVKGLGYTSVKAQLMTVPPWVIGWIWSLLMAWSADRFNARGLHVFCNSLLGGTGFLLAALLPVHEYPRRYGALILMTIGSFPNNAVLTSWVTCNVPTTKTMGLAAAMNNSVVGLSSILAVWIWKSNEAAIGFPTANYTCAACGYLTALFALGLTLYYRKRNAKSHLQMPSVETRLWFL